jgi:hypothetical protein
MAKSTKALLTGRIQMCKTNPSIAHIGLATHGRSIQIGSSTFSSEDKLHLGMRRTQMGTDFGTELAGTGCANPQDTDAHLRPLYAFVQFWSPKPR